MLKSLNSHLFGFRIARYDGYTEKVFKIPQSDKECAGDEDAA